MNKLFKNAIALTGSIATGKSTVSKILKDSGFQVIDADKIAHKLLDENHEKIKELFGAKYIQNNKVLRKELGKIIFSSKENKLKLEALLHPLIKEEIIKQSTILEEKNETYFIDIPLFFENMHYPISKSLLVYTPKNLQTQRLMQRDNITKEEALLKISNQKDIEEKKELADYIIDNSKDIANLKIEIDKFFKEIK